METILEQNIPFSLAFFIHTHSKLSICQVHRGFIPLPSIFQALHEAYSISTLESLSFPSAVLSQLEINVYTSLIIDACGLKLSGQGKFVMPKETVANDGEFLKNLLAILYMKTKDQTSPAMEELKIEIGNYLQLRLPTPHRALESSLHKNNGEHIYSSTNKTQVSLSQQRPNILISSSQHVLNDSNIPSRSSNQPSFLRGNSNNYNSNFQHTGKGLSEYPQNQPTSQSYSHPRSQLYSLNSPGSGFHPTLNNSIPPTIVDKQSPKPIFTNNFISHMNNIHNNFLGESNSNRKDYPRNSNPFSSKPNQPMGLNQGPQPNPLIVLNNNNNNNIYKSNTNVNNNNINATNNYYNNNNHINITSSYNNSNLTSINNNTFNNHKQRNSYESINSKDPMIRFLAVLRKDGLDVIFPQGIQDKILAVVYSLIVEKPISCLRDLLDLIIKIKDLNVLSQIDQVSKNKIRGVLAFLKQSNILVTEILDEGKSVRWVCAKGIKSFEDFREAHDKYILQFLSEKKITIPLSMKAEIIWMFKEQAKKERLLIIDTFVTKTAEFLSTYEYKQTKNIGPNTWLPMKIDNSDLVEVGESDFQSSLTLSDDHKSLQNGNNESLLHVSHEFDSLINLDFFRMNDSSTSSCSSSDSYLLSDEKISKMIDTNDHNNQKNIYHKTEQSPITSSFFVFDQQDYKSSEQN